MEKPHILIVEDEWIIYDDLAAFLSGKGYSIAPYTKNYEEAMARLKSKPPAMVLLDINLQGDKDGIDLGSELSATYKIPFIYLSAYSDKVIVNRARRTNPNTYLIKTKPEIDKEQLAVSITMALSKKTPLHSSKKEGIFVYTNYCSNAKTVSNEQPEKVLLRFDDILWIETDSKKRNYLILHTEGTKACIKYSLTKIKELLPFYIFPG